MDAGRRVVADARRAVERMDPAAVVLVEGASDLVAVEAAAARLGRDLAGERVAVVPMEGFTGIARFLARDGKAGLDVPVRGLCDANEADVVRRAAARAGIDATSIHVCLADLEDELIRALGVAAVEDVLAAEGELASFRRFQRQPAQRDRAPEAQLRRFVGTRAGRKVRLARVMVDALAPSAIPAPLLGVLG